MSDFESVPVGTIAELERIKRERDALAAHVDFMKKACRTAARKESRKGNYAEHVEALDAACEQAPAISLARRDLFKQAEVLEDHAGLITGEHEEGGLLQSAEALRSKANQLEESQWNSHF